MTGLPAGSEIDIGVSQAAAVAGAAALSSRAGKPTPAAKPSQPAARGGRNARSSSRELVPGAPAGSRPPVPPECSRRSRPQGYVFPVYGPATFGDTFGAPRAGHRQRLAPRRGHLRAARHAAARRRRRDRAHRRLERDRRLAPLAARRPGQRVLLRASLRVLAARRRGHAVSTPATWSASSARAATRTEGCRTCISRSTRSRCWRSGTTASFAPYPFLVAWKRAQDVPFTDGRVYVSDTSGLAARRRARARGGPATGDGRVADERTRPGRLGHGP